MMICFFLSFDVLLMLFQHIYTCSILQKNLPNPLQKIGK